MPGRGLQGAVHIQVRPAVRRLPDDGRRRDRRGQHAPGQQVPAGEQSPGPRVAHRGSEESGRQRRGQEADVPLGLAANADARADGQPPARILAGEQAHDQEQRDRPDDEVGSRGGQFVHGPQVLTARRGGERGDDLACPAGAELTAHRGREQNQRGEGERGQYPEPDQRIARDRRGQPRQQRGQRRLVDVAEGRVVAGGQEVQLVAVIAVSCADRHFDTE